MAIANAWARIGVSIPLPLEPKENGMKLCSDSRIRVSTSYKRSAVADFCAIFSVGRPAAVLRIRSVRRRDAVFGSPGNIEGAGFHGLD